MEDNTLFPTEEVPTRKQIEVAFLEVTTSIKEYDDEYKSMFSMLKTETSLLDNPTISKKKKMEMVTSCEFIFVKLRFAVTDELVKIRSILSDINLISDKQWSKYISNLKQREVALNTYQARLNEIRDDMDVFQRFMYFAQNSIKNID